MFRKPAVLLSSDKKAPILADLLDQAVLSLGTVTNVNWLRYASENGSSLRALTGKELQKNETQPQDSKHFFYLFVYLQSTHTRLQSIK